MCTPTDEPGPHNNTRKQSSRRRLVQDPVPDKDKRPRVRGTDINFVCLVCKRLKMKCDRHFPCGRCFRLGQQCRPPPEYLEKNFPAEAASDLVDVASAESTTPPPLRFLELSINTTNPSKLVELFMSIFYERMAQGDLCRKRTVKMLKTYREQSRKALKDVTMGIADAAGRAFDITPWEVEATEEVMWESRPGIPSAKAEYAQGLATLRKSGLYQWAAMMGGGRPDTCFVISGPLKQNFLVVSSESTTFWNTHDINSMMGSHPMLITLMFAGCVDEGDRRAWFDLTIDCLYRKGYMTCSRLIKALDRKGQIRVYLFTARSMFCPELREDVMITCVERAPRSKYVLEHPEHPHRVVNQLRSKDSVPGAQRPPFAAHTCSSSSSSTSSPSSPPSSSSLSSPSRSVPEALMPPLPASSPWVGRNGEEEKKEASLSSAPWLEGKVATALRMSLFGEREGGKGGDYISNDQVEEEKQQQQQQSAVLPGFASLPAPPDSELLLRCVTRAERKDGDEEEERLFREFKTIEGAPGPFSSSSSSSSSFNISSSSSITSSSNSSSSLASPRRPLPLSRMDLKEEVESEEEGAGGDGGGGEGGSEGSGSCSSSTNQHFASIKEEEEEKNNGLLLGMDPILLSAWVEDDVPVFDQTELDLIFFQGAQR